MSSTESSDRNGSMSTDVEPGAPVKDVALLQLALKRVRAETEAEVQEAVDLAQGLADPEVAAQTIALIGHLADRLHAAEQNTAALVDSLQTVAADSSESRAALLEALQAISDRLAEPVSVTVEQPPAARREVTLERDSTGRLSGAVVEEG